MSATNPTMLVRAIAVALAFALLSPAAKPAHAQRVSLQSLLQRIEALESDLVQEKAKVATLETKLADVSVNQAGDIVITGVNLQIVNGEGSTETTNATGNLIIGYNEGPGGIGSHNIVVGSGNEFTSFGGLVAGQDNTIRAPYASVTGGSGNTASGNFSSVSGGFENEAAGLESSVSGGRANFAGGEQSSVSGGDRNVASGNQSSVSGGFVNTAGGPISSVSGGSLNESRGTVSAVSGGNQNVASGSTSSVSGGQLNTASGNTASVSGGTRNTASGLRSSVSGGSLRESGGANDWRAGLLFQEN